MSGYYEGVAIELFGKEVIDEEEASDAIARTLNDAGITPDNHPILIPLVVNPDGRITHFTLLHFSEEDDQEQPS